MSTIGYKDWNVDLAEVGAVYPFQGWEGVMTILGVVFWLAWHIVQTRRESAHLEKAKHLVDEAKIHQTLERY